VTRYVVQRLLLLIPTYLGVTVLVFISVRLVPGGPESAFCAMGCTEADATAIRRDLGLDRPLPAQYGEWARGLVSGDLGRSFQTGAPVAEEIGRRFLVTLELSLLALTLALVLSVPLGIASAVARGGLTDRLTRTAAGTFMAAPGFWVGTLIIAYGGAWFNWAPPIQYSHPWQDLRANLAALLIPVLLLGAATFGPLVRLTRTQFIAVLQQDYLQVARSKGLPETAILRRHALRAGILPVLTWLGVQAPLLLGGTVIVESLFQIPGMGQYLVGSIGTRDFPVIQGVNLVVAAAVLLANFVIDVSYFHLDPRLRNGGTPGATTNA
jgi:peptide/nickel transport system permease protein